MSDLFTRIYTGVVKAFHEAEAEVESLWAKAATIPGVAAIEDEAKSALKQEISNAFAFIDTDLKPHFADAVSMVESAVDTGLLGIVGGVSPAAVPVAQRALPALNSGMTMLFNQMRAVLDHAEADARAAWNLPAADTTTTQGQ